MAISNKQIPYSIVIHISKLKTSLIYSNKQRQPLNNRNLTWDSQTHYEVELNKLSIVTMSLKSGKAWRTYNSMWSPCRRFSSSFLYVVFFLRRFYLQHFHTFYGGLNEREWSDMLQYKCYLLKCIQQLRSRSCITNCYDFDLFLKRCGLSSYICFINMMWLKQQHNTWNGISIII